MNAVALTSSAVSHLRGDVVVPGDKSISHRALILASQVIGPTHISGLLEGEDVLRTTAALRQLGVPVTKTDDVWRVDGVGAGGLHESSTPLEMGNSGTAARLLIGLLAPYPFATAFTGDASLNARPMGRVMTPLQHMGAHFTPREAAGLPLTVEGTATPLPLTYRLPVPSAQIKSAVLLAGLNTPGVTSVIESQATRDHTEIMLETLGFKIERGKDEDGNRITSIAGQQTPPRRKRDIVVPTDPSSAAFLIVAAVLAPEAQLLLRNVCVNPLRAAYLDILRGMGAHIEIKNQRSVGGEAVADIDVGNGALHAIDVPAGHAPMLIDEYPVLAVAAACAKGISIMRGLKELRVKESDRLVAIIEGLCACGINASIRGDDLHIVGTGGAAPGGGTVRTHCDHRIAMAFLVLGMASKNPVTVDDGSMISTSFPGFAELMNHIGGHIA